MSEPEQGVQDSTPGGRSLCGSLGPLPRAHRAEEEVRVLFRVQQEAPERGGRRDVSGSFRVLGLLSQDGLPWDQKTVTEKARVSWAKGQHGNKGTHVKEERSPGECLGFRLEHVGGWRPVD